MGFFGSIIQKIGYSGIIPKSILRFCDDLVMIPSMWIPGNVFRVFLNRLRGVSIGKKVWIGQGVILGQHPFLLTIKDNVIISAGVKILTHDTSFTVVGGKDLAAPVTIGCNVQIGENAIILPGVEIGDRCIIGANAVVNVDIPSGKVAAGVPARVICSVEEGLAKLSSKLENNKYFPTWK